MAKKKTHYVVWKGRSTGVVRTWRECEAMVTGFVGARFKGFYSEAEANEAFQMGIPRKSEASRYGFSPTEEEFKDVGLANMLHYIRYHFTDKECETLINDLIKSFY